MKWKYFEHKGVIYKLDHLHPFSFDLVIPAKDEKPAQSYRINVSFSLHCFSRGGKPEEEIPPELAYSDSRETRVFDFDRHRDSAHLPGLVQRLAERPCFHDSHGNFYVFEVIEADGTKRYYSVFFTLSKAGKKAGLNLYIASAHMRDERPYAHRVKPIRFRVLVYNVWMGKSVKPAPK